MTQQPEKMLYQPDEHDVMDARLRAADKPGKHLWMMTAGWLIANPASASDPEIDKFLDRENLVALAGPGCFKCEQPYSRELQFVKCTGTVD